jgi:streptomycin 6-kinase
VQLSDDVESEHEAEALRFWDGRGAVQLLAHDPDHRALLLERCRPGTQLWDVPEEEAVGIGAAVLRRLWRPAPDEHSYRLLADETVRWAEQLPGQWEELGRPVERSVVDQALAALRELPPTQKERVVCHQDFQGSNVLRAEREPWLAIDPKPIVGERAFDVASFLRDRRSALTAPVVRRRLDRLAEELELDRERVRGWGIAHALAWGELKDEAMTAAARFLAEA